MEAMLPNGRIAEDVRGNRSGRRKMSWKREENQKTQEESREAQQEFRTNPNSLNHQKPIQMRLMTTKPNVGFTLYL